MTNKDETKLKEQKENAFETILLEKTTKKCGLCEDYAQENDNKKYAVLSCEGACLRGEIARQVANHICYDLDPEKTVRICLGGAFTKDTGQRELVRKAKNILAIEGCPIDCASRTMRSVLPDMQAIIVETDKLANFDKSLFGINEMPNEKVISIAQEVAERIVEEHIC